MAIMFGNGTVDQAKAAVDITRTAVVRADSAGKLPDHFVADIYDATTKGSVRAKVYMGSGDTPAGMIAFSAAKIALVSLTKENGEVIQPQGSSDSFESTEWSTVSIGPGEKAFVTYSVKAITKTITISGDSFPGTYYVVGDTYARSDVDGSDQFFQFIIPKAKVTSENTITLEAEGDPSTFSMSLTVLRSETGEMMQLVQYDLTAG